MKKVYTNIQFQKGANVENLKIKTLDALPLNPEIGEICVFNDGDNGIKVFFWNGYYWDTYVSYESTSIAGLKLDKDYTEQEVRDALKIPYPIEFVTALPETPNENTIYLIPEA